MINLLERSYKKEILDNDNIPFADIIQNMKELNTINTYLGGHAVSIAGIKKLIGLNKNTQPITICEIGCGGGDNLNAINNWCIKNNIKATLIGIDIKQECINFAQQQYPNLNAQWIVSDYQTALFKNNKPTIIFSSLFCHHFTKQQLVTMLQWMQQNATKGFFINDLHRHWLAYYTIKIITQIFSRSYLVKNDAPLSVAKGFVKKDWEDIFASASIKKYAINWMWAFRHLITYTHA
jgi:2-polyprenyl-3-methyl-5-hydroxy-6-metoxy-1,4-benzoquinol methylase